MIPESEFISTIDVSKIFCAAVQKFNDLSKRISRGKRNGKSFNDVAFRENSKRVPHTNKYVENNTIKSITGT